MILLCPLRILRLAQQGKYAFACGLVLPGICRGSHETNAAVTCPEKLLCERLLLHLQAIPDPDLRPSPLPLL